VNSGAGGTGGFIALRGKNIAEKTIHQGEKKKKLPVETGIGKLDKKWGKKNKKIHLHKARGPFCLIWTAE